MATSIVRARLAATVSLIAVSLALPAYAQSEQDQATTIDDIIVTAQKREESIQSVPIAVSAFSAEKLDAMKIEGGSELLRAIPNVTFSKSNFSMYNFSIRGVGTKAISASSDPAVAVSFNNSPMIRNRLFESEYLDVNRVEVLRGPQGTLYGRNATAGVVNMIPNLPDDQFDALLKAEAGNYGSIRGQMMLNVPVSDTIALRAAASMTKREGFDYNSHTDKNVNGRDLYSIRLSALWNPNDRFRNNLIWERFEEDDDRARTGKQLCTRDPGPTSVGSVTIIGEHIRGKLSQGCLPGSLYDEAAYQTPNGSGLASLQILSQFLPLGNVGAPSYSTRFVVDLGVDPFKGVVQSRDLREISTSYDPKFRASNQIIQYNTEFDFSDNVTGYYQFLYTEDDYFSTQDYARYLSNPIFNDSDGLYHYDMTKINGSTITPGGIYTDPQLGASNRMLSSDLSKSNNSQSYHEVRLNFDGGSDYKLSVGANYLSFESEDDYYVFNNTFSMLSQFFYGADFSKYPAVVSTNCTDGSVVECVYTDLTGINNLAGDGHNYFRSKNVIDTKSYAIFADGRYSLTNDLGLTVGLRHTWDKKTSTPYPSQLLLGYSDAYGGIATGGSISRGFVAQPDIVQKWDALTGRAVIDWKPNDDVMFYASYAHGYKGGGVNPPRADINPKIVQYQPLAETFDAEYLDAFEIGGKFSLFDNSLRINATAFYYDYKDYQVSQIVDRISLNENFDAISYGLELETVWTPTRNFRLDFNLGLLKTKIDGGEESIDIMNRTQGNKDWMVIRPWAQVPSNCIAPTKHVETILSNTLGQALWLYALSALCSGSVRTGTYDPDFAANIQLYNYMGFTYRPLIDAPNGGRGFMADLSGNELPNAPRWTANVGAQYSWELGGSDLTLRADYYRQAESYFRVYNTEYDRIRSWDSLNIVMNWEVPSKNLQLQAYVKNVLDDAPLLDAFTNSDDSMLTTNVFSLDPRLVGFSVTKRF